MPTRKRKAASKKSAVSADRRRGGGRNQRKRAPAAARASRARRAVNDRVGGARPKVTRTKESLEQRRARSLRILDGLGATYPDATCALTHGSPFELLVATILSAQCTDQRVNTVTPELFKRYPDPAAFAVADPSELEQLIKSTGFFRNKTKSLIGAGKAISVEFGGRVPDAMEDLLKLPGVARKTANCVLGTAYGNNVGIVVDTHVGRVSDRLGLLTTARDDKDAVRIEQDLKKLFPQAAWTYLSHALIDHGRLICIARKPKCSACPLNRDCPSAGMPGSA